MRHDMSSEQMSNRDRARAKALGSNIVKSLPVEHEGAHYEVRKLSLADLERLDVLGTERRPVFGKAGKFEKVSSQYRRSAAALVLAVFDPEDKKALFTVADIPAIMQDRGNPLYEKLGDAFKSLHEKAKGQEEAEGNSDASPSDESSSA